MSRRRQTAACTWSIRATTGCRSLTPRWRHRASFGAALNLSAPKYLAFDADRIWVADEYNHRILLLDRGHRLLGVLGTGKRGRGPNAYYKPEAVLARAPHVWVIDTYNDRIVLLRVEEK